MVSNKHGSNSAVTFKNELISLHLGFKNIKIFIICLKDIIKS
jgi:hypothetical protein